MDFKGNQNYFQSKICQILNFAMGALFLTLLFCFFKAAMINTTMDQMTVKWVSNCVEPTEHYHFPEGSWSISIFQPIFKKINNFGSVLLFSAAKL